MLLSSLAAQLPLTPLSAQTGRPGTDTGRALVARRSAWQALPIPTLSNASSNVCKDRCPTRCDYVPSWYMNSDSTSPHRPPRARHDGWTPERQLAFLGALSVSRSVTRSAAAAGMSRESAYRLRDRPDGALFAARWDQILRRHFNPAPDYEGHVPGAPPASARIPRPPTTS